MKVKLKISMSGPTVSYKPGDIFEGPADECARLCDRGIATPIKSSGKKTADKKTKETAAL